ncbi:sirohydrochlorin chelatase [Sporolactobacillus sp. CPB3-1]|uniref:Sirohydrochlorin chelatase n=1 Tax=Sporolactobacillus mangiferae TaxID=2940498 RepID=A0ABT0MDE5_9BACL|nr:sirohydrochlorin chelatase [Sporolactobacillus mangiferae]MCL1632894.1 sirohydrochlorin chelatase [Sporolactobacillus mangiferae]
MLAVLYVSHGTRVAAGVRQANDFLTQCMKRIAAPIQQICYLERVQPDIQKGIELCVRYGADCVMVQPVLLLSAGHDKRDIPRIIKAARKAYPSVHFIYGHPFGVEEQIIDVLMQRMDDMRVDQTPIESAVVVGRGSSDPDTPCAFSKIASGLRERGVADISVCYMAAMEPGLKEGLEQAARQGHSRIYVVPYLLFPGILTKEIQRTIEESIHRDTFILCRTLGDHPLFISLLKRRVQEAIDHDRLSAHS